jgi:hypothetical protein
MWENMPQGGAWAQRVWDTDFYVEFGGGGLDGNRQSARFFADS